MKNLEGFDLTRIIIGSVAGLVISLVIGLILFWLTSGTVKAHDAGIFSAGYTEFSFIIGVLVASALFGVKQKDVLSAGIVGFIIGLLTSLLEGFVLKLFWDPMNIQFLMGYWGNPTVILIFVGVIVSIGVNLFFSRKN
jgi:uncharacterized membrane protein